MLKCSSCGVLNFVVMCLLISNNKCEVSWKRPKMNTLMTQILKSLLNNFQIILMQIQKLGLEIRKLGNLNNLYKDVDMVLSNYNVPVNGINATIQAATVAHSLQKMLQTQNYFDICCVRNCAELCQICIDKERMKVYQSIHCINWNEMLPDYRQMIVAMVLDDFRSVLNPQNV